MSKKIPSVVVNLERPELITPTILKGEVVSVNDPQQEGRILVYFPVLGGKFGNNVNNTTVDHFKWISYAPVFGGYGENDLMRGPAEEGQGFDDAGTKSSGRVGYGWWAIPRKGATVFCFIANGDPNDMYWFACKYPMKASNTLFGGRFYNNGGKIDGPVTDNDSNLEPVRSNNVKAFGDTGNYEWLSRVADYNPTIITEQDISAELHQLNRKVDTKKADKVNASVTEPDGNTVGRAMKYNQGYARSRSEPTKQTNTQHDIDRLRATEQNSESTMYGFSTPGGHYLSFDDRPEQCRAKIRSASGHTILMDDTNDRIYIATNKGNSWFEMDSNGHIYFFSNESTSFRSEGHINLTADKTIRMWAGESIHLVSEEGEIRVNTKDYHVLTDKYLIDTTTYSLTANDSYMDITNYNIITSDYRGSTTDYSYSSVSADIKNSGVYNLESGGKLSIRSSGVLAMDGSLLASQAGASDNASPSTPGNVLVVEKAWWTNITPNHEPWARVFNGNKDQDELFNHTPEYTYDSPDVNLNMNQIITDYKRGPLWRR